MCVLYLQTATCILHGSIHCPTITAKNTSECTSSYVAFYKLYIIQTILKDGKKKQFVLASDSVFERADALALTGLAEGQ